MNGRFYTLFVSNFPISDRKLQENLLEGNVSIFCPPVLLSHHPGGCRRYGIQRAFFYATVAFPARERLLG